MQKPRKPLEDCLRSDGNAAGNHGNGDEDHHGKLGEPGQRLPGDLTPDNIVNDAHDQQKEENAAENFLDLR